MARDLVKGIIKQTNEDVSKRNEFYEDELLRTRQQGNDTNRKLQQEINKLMDNLQREEGRKISLEEKIKYYEQTIDTLDHKLDVLMGEFNKKDK